MTVFLDGRFLPAEEATISIFDRAFLYGDGLFETVPIFRGRPFRLEAHWERLKRGAEFLKIRLPYSLQAAGQALAELRARNQLDDALARLTLSRGVGPRGYSPQGAEHPRLAISWHPLPLGVGVDLPKWHVISSSQAVLQGNRITRFKTANKLVAVLARAEADAHSAQEALIFNSAGRVAEAAAANLFWIQGGCVCTTPLTEGALDGITRAVVSELCQARKVSYEERLVTVPELLAAEGVFLTLSTWGMVEVSRIDQRDLPASPIVRDLWAAYWNLVKQETKS